MQKKERLPRHFLKIRIAAAVLMVIACVFRFMSGIEMINYNLNVAKDIESSDFAALKPEDKIQGRLLKNEILCIYTKELEDLNIIRYMTVLTPEKKLLVMKADNDNVPDQFYYMEMAMTDNFDFFDYGGYAKEITSSVIDTVYDNIPEAIIGQYELTKEDFLQVFIECEDMSLPYTDYSIVMTFFGGVEMIVLAWFILSRLCDKLIIWVMKKLSKINKPKKTKKDKLPEVEFKPYIGYENDNDDFKDPFSGN